MAVNKAVAQVKLLKAQILNTKKGFISLKAEHRIHKVHFDNILYIEGLKEYVIFYLKKENRIITLESLKRLEVVLPDNFMRIHRSHIINKNEVKSLYGNMVEIGDKRIIIGNNL